MRSLTVFLCERPNLGRRLPQRQETGVLETAHEGVSANALRENILMMARDPGVKDKRGTGRPDLPLLSKFWPSGAAMGVSFKMLMAAGFVLVDAYGSAAMSRIRARH